jgi:hypothetical protein
MGIVALVVIVTAEAARRAAVVRAVVAGLGVWIVLCVPLAAPYRSAARVVGERQQSEIRQWSALPQDFLAPHPDNAVYGNPASPGEGERRLFPGIVAPALTLAAVAPPLSAASVAYAAILTISADLALGMNGVGYETLYRWLPPLRAVRVPPRFAMIVGLALAVLAGLGIDRLTRHRQPATQLALAALVVAAVTVESRPRALELREVDDPMPAVYQWLAAQPRGVVCEYPVGNLQGRIVPQDATYMYYSTHHWQPMLNGYSGFVPASYLELLDRLKDFPDDGSIAYLKQRGVKYLLVHNAFTLTYIHGDYEEDVRRLSARSELERVGRFPWRGGGSTEVFRFK